MSWTSNGKDWATLVPGMPIWGAGAGANYDVSDGPDYLPAIVQATLERMAVGGDLPPPWHIVESGAAFTSQIVAMVQQQIDDFLTGNFVNPALESNWEGGATRPAAYTEVAMMTEIGESRIHYGEVSHVGLYGWHFTEGGGPVITAEWCKQQYEILRRLVWVKSNLYWNSLRSPLFNPVEYKEAALYADPADPRHETWPTAWTLSQATGAGAPRAWTRFRWTWNSANIAQRRRAKLSVIPSPDAAAFTPRRPAASSRDVDVYGLIDAGFGDSFNAQSSGYQENRYHMVDQYSGWDYNSDQINSNGVGTNWIGDGGEPTAYSSTPGERIGWNLSSDLYTISKYDVPNGFIYQGS